MFMLATIFISVVVGVGSILGFQADYNIKQHADIFYSITKK